MNAIPDGIIVNSCQYTPVYLIQDPGASQGQSYFIAQTDIEEPKPVSDNLKAFYESSGNIENSVVNVNSGQKPRILKKPEHNVVGNNLKLASFLLPKNKKQPNIVNNVITKSNVTNTSNSSCANTGNTVPRLNIDSKIVKLKNIDLKTKYNRIERPSPKTKPKEVPQTQIVTPVPTKLTSVQLLKLGETYHSLNQLSNDQMKMVTHALKIFSNPEKIAPEPTYDPVTNTKYIYKLVSPRDLTVVGKNKIVKNKTFETNTDDDSDEVKKETKETQKEIYIKDLGRKVILKTDSKTECIVKNDASKKEAAARKIEEKKQKIQKEIIGKIVELEEELEVVEPKVTRSGRKVKLPKVILPEGSPHKPRRKNTFVTCFQCSAEFNSLYRLQKHYESHPTHIPAKIHSNLFHCLLAIIKGGTEEDRTNIFIQQLEQLIVKLRSLLPCLLKNEGTEGQACTINEDVSRLLGLEPGKYNFDIDALNCVKNKDGYCRHNKPPFDPNAEGSQSEEWITMNQENTQTNCDSETEDCARINSVEKWPTVNKRVWKLKQQKSENAKRMRMTSENVDTHIELGMDNLVTLGDCVMTDQCSAILSPKGAEHKSDICLVDKLECKEFSVQPVSLLAEETNLQSTEPMSLKEDTNFLNADPVSLLQTDPVTNNESISTMEEAKPHPQFHSAHFDIRSSPIKPTSTVFTKFQINPEILSKYEADTIRSIETVSKSHEIETRVPQGNSNNILNNKETIEFNSDKCTLSHKDTLQEIFRDEDLAVVKESFTLDRDLKDWILNRSADDKSEDDFCKSNTMIEPALIYVNNHELKTSTNNEIEQKVDLPSDNHDESSVLNFLDSLASDCLSYPGTEIRTNNGDFQMDLFSFHSS